MQRAIIVSVPQKHILGQSIGFVVTLKRHMRLGRLIRICNRLTNGSSHERVSINILGSHGDIPGNCISVAFHFPMKAVPVSEETISHRSRVIRQWLRDEFNVTDFDEKAFHSREELCGYLHDPLTVM